MHFASVVMNTNLAVDEKTRGKWVCYARKFLDWLPVYWSPEFGKVGEGGNGGEGRRSR